MEAVKILLEKLVPDPKNTRQHDERNVETIKASLLEFGQYRDFVVQKKGNIIRIGNGMYQAMSELRDGKLSKELQKRHPRYNRADWKYGMAKVVDLSDHKAEALSIMDNRSAELATWDEKIMSEIIQGLPEDLTGLTGFNDDEIEALLMYNSAGDWKPDSALFEPEDEELKGAKNKKVTICPKCGNRFHAKK